MLGMDPHYLSMTLRPFCWKGAHCHVAPLTLERLSLPALPFAGPLHQEALEGSASLSLL